MQVCRTGCPTWSSIGHRANLTIIGSLATMISLSIIGKKGMNVSGLVYLKVGLLCVPVTLIFAVLGLWLTV